MEKRSAIVVGAGIVGLATAKALCEKGFSVKVFERNHKAVGASIRNFGMIWPIGQPSGKLYSRAIRSRNIWKEFGDMGRLWYDPAGSLHVAYHEDEWAVLNELFDLFQGERNVELLTPSQIATRTEAVRQENLLGGLYCAEELIIDPREAMGVIPRYLEEKYDVQFFWGKCVSYISDHSVYIGDDADHEADLVFLCSGADFQTLYPEAFDGLPLVKCKLQMMRFAAQSGGWRIGPALCGGLSLVHYKSFSVAPSLPVLQQRYATEMKSYLDWGIHVMAAQNGSGEVVVGDSHEYGNTLDPFDKDFINKMILDYLRKFVQLKDWKVIETWNGTYPKLTNGETDLCISPDPGVYIINGVGGAGMTLSFGLAEELLDGL
jgi:FAD dependent oxidoreductase TIGR03364